MKASSVSASIFPNSSSNPKEPNTQQLHTKPNKTIFQTTHFTTRLNRIFPSNSKRKFCLEIMGVDSGKALSLNPNIHSASLSDIHLIITFLESKGIHQKDLPRIFGMCPKILTSDLKNFLKILKKDLIPVFKFLENDLKFHDHDFRKVINKCPRLLISSVPDQLKPALFYLQRLGFKDLKAIAYQDPVLIVSGVEKTLIPKLECLIGFGFSKDEAVKMVLRCPSLFIFNIETNFKPKIEYYVKEMNGELDELKEFPQFSSFSLEKRIIPRHNLALENGLKVSLPVLLKSSEEEFTDLIIKQSDGSKY